MTFLSQNCQCNMYKLLPIEKKSEDKLRKVNLYSLDEFPFNQYNFKYNYYRLSW